ncbi:MAG: DUF4097 family beta strand repeat protein [Clostridia bacterium]|nr:DUF4097 family beta strand repeat protein [Clostridia bacterium]
MTKEQRWIKNFAIGLAVLLIVGIFSGILGVLKGITLFFSDSEKSGEMTDYPVSSEVRSLELFLSAAQVTIQTGEKFAVCSNLENLKVSETGGVLTLREKKALFRSTKSDAALTLTVPENFVFERAEISTGAGALTADSLSAMEIEMELGAGKVFFSHLSAQRSADIQGGVGKITVENGSLHNLQAEMGVGEWHYTGFLTGEAELEFGIGNSKLILLGQSEDYRLECEKGIGNLTVDNKRVSGNETIGSGENKIRLEAGIGNIEISFQGE